MSQQFPENPKVGSSFAISIPSNDPNAAESTASTQPDLPPQSESQTEPQTPAHVHPTIIDVVHTYQTGNYLPLLHCLNSGLIDLDFRDQAGYHPLHSAVSMNLIPIVVLLIDHYKVDVNIRAKSGQTPLMIAANYSHLQLAKMLIDRGANVNDQEDTRFSALLYSVKQSNLALFAYLLAQNADIYTKDLNGCTVVHWAAYKNHVYLLKILNGLGLDMNSLDHTGLTPLDRAIQSNGYKAVEYLLEVGNGTMPPNMDYPKITDADMKEILRRKFYPTSFETKWDEAINCLKQHSQKATVGIYAGLWLVGMIVFFHAVMFQDSNYPFGLGFVVFSLYSIAYTCWYFTRSNGEHKSTNKRGYGKLISSSLDHSFGESEINRGGRELSQRMSYGSLNKLLPNDFQRGNEFNSPASSFPSFLHELAYLVQTGMYKEAERFSVEDYCPACLIKRTQRSSHCSQEKTCVDEFCHYSYSLGKSITRNDHYLYLIHVINQMILLSFFMLLVWSCYWSKVHNTKVFIAEVGYILWEEFGLLYAGFYALALWLSLYSAFFTTMEVYGVLKNITYYEIFNSSKCTYLYQVSMDRKGSFVKSFENPFDKGKWNNLKAYMERVFHTEK